MGSISHTHLNTKKIIVKYFGGFFFEQNSCNLIRLTLLQYLENFWEFFFFFFSPAL